MRRKSFLTAILLCATVCLTVLFGTPFSAFASTKKSLIITEDFSSGYNEQIWSASGGVGLVSQGGALKIKNGTFSQMVGWKGLRNQGLNEEGVGDGLSGDYSIEFTVSALDASWVALYLGERQPAIGFSKLNETNYGSVLVMKNSGISHFVGQGKQEGKSYPWKNVALKSDGTRYKIKIEAKCGCGNAADAPHERSEHFVNVYIAEEPKYGNAHYGDKVATINNVYTEGYFGFGSMNEGVAAFSDIIVRDGNGKKLYEPTDLTGDFDMIEYISSGGSAAYYDCEWRVWKSATEEAEKTFVCEPSAYVSLNGDGSLVNDYPFVKNDESYTQYDVEFILALRELAGKDFSVALKTENELTSLLQFMKNESGYFVKDMAGNSFKLKNSVFKMKMSVKQSKTAQIYADGAYLGTVSLKETAGNFAFVTQKGQLVNLFGYKSWFYTNVSSAAPSVSTDFSVIDNDDGKSYVNPDEFLYTGNVKRYKGYNELAFSNANRNSMVATRYAYGEYVVKFDLVDITQGNENNILLFSFAKPAYNETFKTVPTIIFVPRGYDGSTVGYANMEALNGLKFTSASGATATSIRMEKNIFNDLSLVNYKKNQVALNVMFIVRNRTISVHYKYSNQPESELILPRAVCYDVDTYGYFSIGGNSKANFSVKNLSITNLEF